MPTCQIKDIAPSTYCIRRNAYHVYVPLFVMDCVRLFQDHPKYAAGLKESDIINLYEKEAYATGDMESQVKQAIKELTSYGYIRYINQGYRTLGPFARLALARTPRQFNITWDRLSDLNRASTATLPTPVFNFRHNTN